jgi:hypothetical protein
MANSRKKTADADNLGYPGTGFLFFRSKTFSALLFRPEQAV